MIIKGKKLVQAGRNAIHLEKVRDPSDPRTAKWNDHVELVCCNNLIHGDNLRAAAREMEAVASGSKALKPIYAVAINPDRAGGKELTNGQAEYSAQFLLEELGFSPEHQWILMRHEKDGRVHFHVLANRVHPVTLIAVELSHNYRTHERVAREMEKHFGLPVTPGAFAMPTIISEIAPGAPRPKRKRYKISEEQQAERTGLPLEKVEADISWAWSGAVNGQEFCYRLANRGYSVSKGDRRDLIVVDGSGGVHNPVKRLGIRVKDFREKTRDLAKLELPTVEAVRGDLKPAPKPIEQPLQDDSLPVELDESQVGFKP